MLIERAIIALTLLAGLGDTPRGADPLTRFDLPDDWKARFWGSPDAVALLENEVGHERANAEAEVRRMTVPDYDPLYQAAYLVGGWQFWALRREVVGHTLGAKAYHDAILHENQMPVAALRAILRPETCTDDGPALWPFADHIRPGLLD